MREELEKVKSLLTNIIELDKEALPGPWEYSLDGMIFQTDGKGVAVNSAAVGQAYPLNSELPYGNASFIVAAKSTSAPMAKALLEAIERIEGNILFESLLQSIISTILKNTEVKQ